MRLGPSDMTSLNVFRAVVDYGGFVGAQHALNISQSSVSQYICNLEERLGFRLCERGRAGFSLTEKGEKVYQHAKKIFQLIDNVSGELGEIRSQMTGSLRFGIADNTISNPTLPLERALSQFLERSKLVQVDINIGTSLEMEAKLIKGDISVALIPAVKKNDSLVYREIYVEEQSLYCGRHHPLFSQPDISTEDVEQHDLVVRPYSENKELLFLKNARIAAHASNMEALAIFVLSGRFVGFLPRHYAQTWTARGEMRQLMPQKGSFGSTFYIVTRRDARTSQLMATFIDDLFSRLAPQKGKNGVGLVT